MGLIKAITGALGGTLADSWKEYFYCESLGHEILVTKGQKRVSGRSSNTKGNDNIISQGSVIAVADGQCMIIVEQGRIVDFCAEPGEYTYNASTEPSLFAGNLGESIRNTFSVIGKRFTFGGDTAKDQRVYYFNTKEIIENKFGTANPIPFRIVDDDIGFKVSLSVRCSGVYSYRIQDPLLFYKEVCGNVEDDFPRSEIDTQLKTEFISALQPAFAKLSALRLLPEDLVAHTTELEQAINEALTAKWLELRGIRVVSVALGSVTLPEESQKKLADAQIKGMYRNPAMAAAMLAESQGEAMKNAASNPNGAMAGFMGMGMAMNMGNQSGVQALYQMAGQNAQQAPVINAGDEWNCGCGAKAKGNFCAQCGGKKPAPVQNPDAWVCPNCGCQVTGKFCTECGTKKPEQSNEWVCGCGAKNTGKFCMNCGAKKPEVQAQNKCNKCGWTPEDPAHPPKFCPQCGDAFK